MKTTIIAYDDGPNWYIDGNTILSSLSIDAAGAYSTTMILQAFSIYSLRVDWHEYNSGANIKLNWSSPTISYQVVSADNFATSSDVSLSPYQIKVVCPVGYTPDGLNLLQWVVLCGDGLSYENEVWDDGNTANGDGCRNDCMQIDDGWIWVGGNKTHIDVCSLWDVGYEPNQTKDRWVQISLSIKAKIQVISTVLLILLGSIFNLI